ncbi:hypothetical protein N7463_000476 [Penicillium fimorum]|uniref:Uncharacterized protein n=1 Tax=Penicillium fimorum TaxID=1882269 RepID=A0A9W9Y561_9EURO|nr:hypothetical protein N7463_000476 [Penicillium fimorum]
MHAIEGMLSRRNQHQALMGNMLSTLEQRMRELVQEVYDLQREEVLDSHIERAICLQMLVTIRSRTDEWLEARAAIYDVTCFLMETVQVVIERGYATHQLPLPNVLDAIEQRMEILLDDMNDLLEEQIHDSRVEEVIWMEAGEF